VPHVVGALAEELFHGLGCVPIHAGSFVEEPEKRRRVQTQEFVCISTETSRDEAYMRFLLWGTAPTLNIALRVMIKARVTVSDASNPATLER
jgi:hypothetical protein